MYEIKAQDILDAQNGNEEVMSKIIESNSGLLWSIIKRFLGRGYDGEELYQVACIGFIKSIKRFNTEYDFKLSTFAVPYILGEIKRFIRDDGPIKVSRSIKELLVKIKEIQNKYLNEKGEEITISKIAEELKISKEEVAMALESQKPLESIDSEVYNDDKDGESKISKITNGKDEANELINTICIKDLIKKLNPREQKIIVLRYYKEKTQNEVAKILGITQVQVSRIEKKILLSMREKIS